MTQKRHKHPPKTPKLPTKSELKQKTLPIRTREARAYTAWQLHTQHIPVHQITQMLKSQGYKRCSTTTINRDLADIRAKMKIDRAQHPESYKRDLHQSVDEKQTLLKVLWDVVNQPPRVSPEGDFEDRSFFKIQGVKAATTISVSLDRLYGLDLSSLRSTIDELKADITAIKGSLAAKTGSAPNQGADSSKPSSGSSASGSG